MLSFCWILSPFNSSPGVRELQLLKVQFSTILIFTKRPRGQTPQQNYEEHRKQTSARTSASNCCRFTLSSMETNGQPTAACFHRDPTQVRLCLTFHVCQEHVCHMSQWMVGKWRKDRAGNRWSISSSLTQRIISLNICSPTWKLHDLQEALRSSETLQLIGHDTLWELPVDSAGPCHHRWCSSCVILDRWYLQNWYQNMEFWFVGQRRPDLQIIFSGDFVRLHLEVAWWHQSNCGHLKGSSGCHLVALQVVWMILGLTWLSWYLISVTQCDSSLHVLRPL